LLDCARAAACTCAHARASTVMPAAACPEGCTLLHRRNDAAGAAATAAAAAAGIDAEADADAGAAAGKRAAQTHRRTEEL